MKKAYALLIFFECALFAGTCVSVQKDAESVVIKAEPPKRGANRPLKKIVIGEKKREKEVPAELGAESRRLSADLGNLEPQDVVEWTAIED